MFKLNNKMIALILSMIVIVLGVTFALYRWNSSDNTNVSLTFAGAGEVIYTKGQDIDITNIGPVLDVKEGASTTFSVKKNTTDEVTVDVNFTPTNLPEELKDESFKYVLQVSVGGQKYNYIYVYPNKNRLDGYLIDGNGSFDNKSVNNKFNIIDNYLMFNNKIDFKLIIYIDGNMNNPVDMQGKSFSGTFEVVLHTRVIPDSINVPDGLIPVIYDETDQVWKTISDSYLLGDINGDDKVSSADAGMALSIEGNTGYYEERRIAAADVNGDGTVTQDDATLILDLNLSRISTFPAGAPLEEKMYIPTGSDKSWYDYDNQKWANAVMVTSATRDTYMTAPVGTTVNDSDILAHYVWIPRYKYKLWNTAFTASSPQEIDVVFEKTTDPISNGTQNDEYLSHPAFWWDADSDGIREEGEELSGIWVGKFEVTGDTTTPTILPNISPLTNQIRSSFFTAIQKFNTNYYLSENGILLSDSHMIKNMEWGAIAYLAHSKYGINGNIGINNYYSSGLKTGCGAASSASTSSTCNSYRTVIGQSASTTGNITGIYDMSGGAWELVMNFMLTNKQDGSILVGYDPTYKTGFAGTLYYDNSLNNTWPSTTGLPLPNYNYYDLYAYGTTYNDQAAYNRSHLGDATGETRAWYSDDANMPYSAFGGIYRGGTYNVTSSAGIFSFRDPDGYNDNVYSSRAILINPVVLK